MNPLFAAALDIQAFLAARSWGNTVIGGLAVQRWGEPRQTRDVDLTLVTGVGDEAAFIDPLLAHYPARRPDARAFALSYRVVLLETASGIPVDISLAALPYEERVVERSTDFEFAPGCVVRTCSAEDLVVLKAVADRPQDWLDVQGIVVRQGVKLDRDLITSELGPLLELKEDDSPRTTLQKIFARHRRSSTA